MKETEQLRNLMESVDRQMRESDESNVQAFKNVMQSTKDKDIDLKYSNANEFAWNGDAQGSGDHTVDELGELLRAIYDEEAMAGNEDIDWDAIHSDFSIAYKETFGRPPRR